MCAVGPLHVGSNSNKSTTFKRLVCSSVSSVPAAAAQVQVSNTFFKPFETVSCPSLPHPHTPSPSTITGGACLLRQHDSCSSDASKALCLSIEPRISALPQLVTVPRPNGTTEARYVYQPVLPASAVEPLAAVGQTSCIPSAPWDSIPMAGGAARSSLPSESLKDPSVGVPSTSPMPLGHYLFAQTLLKQPPSAQPLRSKPLNAHQRQAFRQETLKSASQYTCVVTQRPESNCAVRKLEPYLSAGIIPMTLYRSSPFSQQFESQRDNILSSSSQPCPLAAFAMKLGSPFGMTEESNWKAVQQHGPMETSSALAEEIDTGTASLRSADKAEAVPRRETMKLASEKVASTASERSSVPERFFDALVDRDSSPPLTWESLSQITGPLSCLQLGWGLPSIAMTHSSQMSCGSVAPCSSLSCGSASCSTLPHLAEAQEVDLASPMGLRKPQRSQYSAAFYKNTKPHFSCTDATTSLKATISKENASTATTACMISSPSRSLASTCSTTETSPLARNRRESIAVRRVVADSGVSSCVGTSCSRVAAPFAFPQFGHPSQSSMRYGTTLGPHLSSVVRPRQQRRGVSVDNALLRNAVLNKRQGGRKRVWVTGPETGDLRRFDSGPSGAVQKFSAGGKSSYDERCRIQRLREAIVQQQKALSATKKTSLELETLLSTFVCRHIQHLNFKQLQDLQVLLSADPWTLFSVLSCQIGAKVPSDLVSNTALPLLLQFVNASHPLLTNLPSALVVTQKCGSRAKEQHQTVDSYAASTPSSSTGTTEIVVF